ncbi:GTPase HflX [Candidatus Marinamargulisbacteria bacterium SCGC AG-343-D04]|nr:GTPase HflX [Candidatus Marinamargulisbacteria bacterium SCGC AG-343-D04]
MTSQQHCIRAVTLAIDYKSSHRTIPLLDSLQELNELAKTAHIDIIQSFHQNRSTPSRSSYIGKGKIEEVKLFILKHDITCVITDDELTPAQSKFLEKNLDTKVIDRTGLILEIFAFRAQTYEAKLQVELAQLNYLKPRLTNLWTHLSRLGGGIGTKGPGETQLETDKREISRKISHIQKKLKKIQNDRHVRRKSRSMVPILTGAIIGYTNAGKSTLINRLTQSNLFVEDKLFATLDPTSRQCSFGAHNHVILTDTVGFIQKLPTHLIKAFYSTLEEVTEADFLLHVVDASHPCILEFIQTSSSIIQSLNADKKPILYVFNKWDKVLKKNTMKSLLSDFNPKVFMSATKDNSLDAIHDGVQDLLAPFSKTDTFFIPYDRMDIFNLFQKYGDVHDVVYDKTISIKVTINSIISDKIISSLY